MKVKDLIAKLHRDFDPNDTIVHGNIEIESTMPATYNIKLPTPKLKPTFEVGKTYWCRDGKRQITIYRHSQLSTPFPVIGTINNDSPTSYNFTHDGSYSLTVSSPLDLMGEVKEGWDGTLEVGKRYVTRCGHIVEVKSIGSSELNHPILTTVLTDSEFQNDTWTYMLDGKYWLYNSAHPRDIIGLAPE